MFDIGEPLADTRRLAWIGNSAGSVVRSTKHKVLLVVAWLGVWAGGCRAKDQPTSRPAPVGKPAVTLIVPESVKWSREEACAKLADDKLGLSAAIRLVRLAEAAPLCVPAELTDEHVRQLRAVRLSEQRWALGLADKASDRRLRAAIFISADGEVTLPAEGTEEELLVLHISKDADVFPHLLVLPDRVLVIGEPIVTALELEPEQTVRFELREYKGYPYVALVFTRGSEAVEAARYKWDTDELVFAGPAQDKLPDPPGGKLRVDLKASRRFVPVGGEIPEPKLNPPPRPAGPVQRDDAGAQRRELRRAKSEYLTRPAVAQKGFRVRDSGFRPGSASVGPQQEHGGARENKERRETGTDGRCRGQTHRQVRTPA